MDRIAIAAALWLLPASLCAQWLDFRTPGIPRTADGKPNLTAPAPRTADGKPDLSGLWRPEFNPYNLDVIQDLKDEAIFRPSGGGPLQTAPRGFPYERSHYALPPGRSLGDSYRRGHRGVPDHSVPQRGGATLRTRRDLSADFYGWA